MRPRPSQLHVAVAKSWMDVYVSLAYSPPVPTPPRQRQLPRRRHRPRAGSVSRRQPDSRSLKVRTRDIGQCIMIMIKARAGGCAHTRERREGAHVLLLQTRDARRARAAASTATVRANSPIGDRDPTAWGRAALRTYRAARQRRPRLQRGGGVELCQEGCLLGMRRRLPLTRVVKGMMNSES